MLGRHKERWWRPWHRRRGWPSWVFWAIGIVLFMLGWVCSSVVMRSSSDISLNDIPCDLRLIGGRDGFGTQSYGVWPTCVDNFHPDDVVYSFGLGDDITFGIDLIKNYGIKNVHGFDPTILDRQALEDASNAMYKLPQQRHKVPENYNFYSFGLAAQDGKFTFYQKKNGKGSQTIIPNVKDMHVSKMVGQLYRLETVMEMLGHTWIDLLKIDVEGAEFEWLNQVESIPASQILIEFHERFYENGHEYLKEAYEALKRHGFFRVHVADTQTQEEVTFLRVYHRDH